MVQIRKILVIDDDQSVCDTFARTLSGRGYEVYTETRYQDGVKKADEVLPDLLFVSLLLDTTNGLKVSKEIHAMEKLRKVPIVMLISYKGELDPKYTVTIGVVDVLVKPPRENDIIVKTETILGPDADLNKQEQRFQGFTDRESYGTIRDRAEGIERAGEYVSESTGNTDKERFDFYEGNDEVPELPDEEASQNEEYSSQSGYAESGRKEIREDIPVESVFEEVDEAIEGTADFGESDSKSPFNEDWEADANLGTQGEDGFNYFGEDERNGKGRKILMIAAALVVVAVIGVGTYMGLQFLFGGKDRPVVQSSAEDEPDRMKEKAASLPQRGSVSGEEKAVAERSKETFSLQVGFFGNLKNAEVLSEKMKRQGYKAFIKKEEKASGKISYRVLVGKYSSRNEALEYSKIILQKEGIKPVLYKE